MMGGDISLESVPGKGSTFSFTVPCTRNTTEAPIATNLGSLEGIRTIVIDDLPINLKLISEQLEFCDARCDVALNGEDALQKMEQAARDGTPHQIAIIDYLMPEMNGEMLACAIKDNPLLKDCCLVMLTAAGTPVMSKSYAEKGFSAHLAKPINKYNLLKSLAYIWSKYKEGCTNELIQVDAQKRSTDKFDTAPNLNGVSILMAEDNLVNQAFIQEIIEEMQCSLHIAQNGREALDALQKNRFDLVLMDCLMPVMDGFEATAEITKLKQNGSIDADLPVIALTANAMKGDREKCLAAGMDDYLAKPIRKNELQKMVMKWVSFHSDRTETGSTGKTEEQSPVTQQNTEKTDDIETEETLLIDEDDVTNARNILKEKYDDMVGVYLENSRQRIEEIMQALQANDIEAVIRPAHTLKSSSKQMGALRLSNMAKNIEYAAKEILKDDAANNQDITFIDHTATGLTAVLNETETAFEKIVA